MTWVDKEGDTGWGQGQDKASARQSGQSAAVPKPQGITADRNLESEGSHSGGQGVQGGKLGLLVGTSPPGRGQG